MVTWLLPPLLTLFKEVKRGLTETHYGVVVGGLEISQLKEFCSAHFYNFKIHLSLQVFFLKC